jgi:hypothetical protein
LGTVLFYVQQHERAVTQRLVDWLQHSDFAAVIFCREESEGTFSLSLAKLDVPTAPDLIVAMRWYGDANQFGVQGLIDADWNRKAGEGTHATLSSLDVGNIFIAAGPHFPPMGEQWYPTGNIDLTPTVIDILKVNPGTKVDGRSLITAESAPKQSPQVYKGLAERQRSFGEYEWHQKLFTSEVSGTLYFDRGNGTLMPRPSDHK